MYPLLLININLSIIHYKSEVKIENFEFYRYLKFSVLIQKCKKGPKKIKFR